MWSHKLNRVTLVTFTALYDLAQLIIYSFYVSLTAKGCKQ